MSDNKAFGTLITAPLLTVPELPFRWLIEPDTINSLPAAHFTLSLPNVTVRVTFDQPTGLDAARELKDALLGVPAPKRSGLTVVENGIVTP